MQNQTEIYPHAPLLETIFEIRFPGELSVECRRDVFYESVRSRFPILRVPLPVPGEPRALQPYEFESDDGSDKLMVSLNSFAYSTKRYRGFGTFKEVALEYVMEFGEMFKLAKIHRTGLRYINVIPFTREEGLVPLEHYLTLNLNLANRNLLGFKDFSVALATPANPGMLTVRIGTISNPQGEALLLDFDFAREKDLDLAKIAEYLQESHDFTKRFFEELITDNYQRLMRGEVVT